MGVIGAWAERVGGRWVAAAAALGLGLGLAGHAEAQSCVPGAQAACACPGGPTGVQVCTIFGTYEPCRCSAPAGPSAPPPAHGPGQPGYGHGAPGQQSGYGHGAPGQPPGQPGYGYGAPMPQYRTVEEPIWGLVIAGPIVWGTVWLATVGVTAGVSSDSDRGEAVAYAAIPLVGPWVMIGSSLDTDDYAAPLVISGILQASGLAMLVLGLTLHTTRTVAVYGTEEDVAERWVAVSPVPLSSHGAGLAAVGVF